MVVDFLHNLRAAGYDVSIDLEGISNPLGLVAGDVDCLVGSFGGVRRNSGRRVGVTARARWRLWRSHGAQAWLTDFAG